MDKKLIADSIRIVPDFPKTGINFMDITTLLNNGKLFQEIINHLSDRYKNMQIDYIVGIESRGFLFGTPLAIALGIGFVPIRKKGKLPAETFSVDYALEYGNDTLEIHKDAFYNKKARVILVDDLLATGGTAKATSELIAKAGGEIIENLFIINLKFLNGESKLNSAVYSILDIN